jgi:hypothetical protein
VERATPPALAEPVVLPKAQARPAAREDTPTRPKVPDYAFRLAFTLLPTILARRFGPSGGPIHRSAWKVTSQKLISVGSPPRPQRPLPGLLMDTPPYVPDEFFGLLRRK